jgi:AcrR family transcriptional regulator
MRPLPVNLASNAPSRITAPLAQPKRPRNREATIRAVLESAQRLFTTKGFDRTSLVDIAAETGLSPRGVILHFSSKADIAAELMFRDMRARAESYRAEESVADTRTQIRSFFAWLAEGDRRMFINFAALWSFAARWSEKLEATAEQATADLLAPVRAAVEAGIASGELRNVDPRVACEVLWLAYLSGLRRAAVRGGKPADALPQVEETLALLRA